MDKRMDKKLIWILLPVLVLAVAFAVEALVQLPLLTLPQEQRGVHTIDLMDVDMSYDEEYPEEETEGVLQFLPGAVATIPCEGYVGEMTLIGEASGVAFTLECEKPDGSTKTTEHLFFALADRDVSRVGTKVEEIALSFAEAATITEIRVSNVFAFNLNRMLLVGLLTACVYLLIALRREIAQHLEYGFLIIALAAGLYMSIGLPPTVTLNFDDHIHFNRVSQLSYGKYANQNAQEADMSLHRWGSVIGGVYKHTGDTYAEERMLAEMINTSAESEAELGLEVLQYQFSDTGYITQAVGFTLAKLLGLPFTAQFIAGRVFNMLTYVALCFMAIRTLKRFKGTMMVLALMPTPMFLACNYTYDPTINGLCFLGIALVMEAIMSRGVKLSWQRGLGILLCLTIGALTKVVYMPLLLLVLLLPRSKFHSNFARVWYKAMAMVLMLTAILSMLTNVSSGAVALQDSRGPGADSAAQMSFILSHPLTYLGYFFQTIWEEFTTYFADGPRTTLAYAGQVEGMVSTLGFWLLLFTALTDNDTSLRQHLNWKQRTVMFLIAGMVVGMVFSTMYVAFSPVGVRDFSGVQPRYLIPMLPLLYMIISCEGIHNRMNKRAWPLVLCLANAALIGAVCLQLFAQYSL